MPVGRLYRCGGRGRPPPTASRQRQLSAAHAVATTTAAAAARAPSAAGRTGAGSEQDRGARGTASVGLQGSTGRERHPRPIRPLLWVAGGARTTETEAATALMRVGWGAGCLCWRARRQGASANLSSTAVCTRAVRRACAPPPGGRQPVAGATPTSGTGWHQRPKPPTVGRSRPRWSAARSRPGGSLRGRPHLVAHPPGVRASSGSAASSACAAGTASRRGYRLDGRERPPTGRPAVQAARRCDHRRGTGRPWVTRQQQETATPTDEDDRRRGQAPPSPPYSGGGRRQRVGSRARPHADGTLDDA